MDVAASYNQRLPWPAVMDVSPEDRPVAIRTSSMGSTPLDTHAKRLRSEAELDSCPLHEPDEPPLKRMEFTPCHSPTRAEQTPPEDMASVMPPRRLASVGFGTPISGHPICCPLESHAGAAAVALVVTPNHLTALTHDHVAERSICAEEADRVERAGASNVPGSVRVGEHDLPMTRAFGNLRLKVAAGRDWTQEAANAQVVTALPDVSVFARGPDDLAVVVASDGLFGEVLSSEHVAEYTRAALQENAATGDAEGMAARRLVERAIHHQSSDNVSVVVVSLEPSEGSAASPDLAQESPDLLREDSTATQSFSPGRRVASSEAYPEEVRARRSLSPEEERS
ncbi:hypothetical protein EMIHUDRAFT_460046 [Emiliania huxleyi CCMP1516]|uniref:PPM-type phosphatase domain-containing protein n=2 Tax=Emiliania huxleyi TaxID=2903 RepID=A0A0D3I8K6_EMIH1|nr:hypothetical protein EMIHUDRAFT_460046 [Emiliania huxleyi CCMP1516]EOD07591.1 hypothetical protein EMIHUDRAFT_460046 [Emiliania huxleyi CCMP1516]|eukprot:XP_005760020.1 hypothetical protein EMIHUDRAFT_460046 [Emiliania huxleyi CCMP1516]